MAESTSEDTIQKIKAYVPGLLEKFASIQIIDSKSLQEFLEKNGTSSDLQSRIRKASLQTLDAESITNLLSTPTAISLFDLIYLEKSVSNATIEKQAQKNAVVVKKLEHENEDLKKLLKVKENELKAMSENYDKVKKHLHSLRESFNSATNSIRQYEERINSFAEERIKYIQDLKEAHATIEERRSKLSELNEQLVQTKIKLTEVDYEKTAIQVKLKEIVDQQEKANKKHEQNEDALISNQKLISLLDKVYNHVFSNNVKPNLTNEEKLFELQAEIERMRESLIEYDEQTVTFSETFQWLLKDKANNPADTQEKTPDFKRKISFVNDTLGELIALNESRDQIAKENSELKQVIESKEKEIDRLVQESEIQQKRVEECSHQIEELKHEKEILLQQNVSIKRAQEESEQLFKAQEKELQDAINITNAKVNELQEKIEELTHIRDKETIEYKRQIDTSDAKIAEIQQENEILNSRLIETMKIQEELKSEVKEKIEKADEFSKKLEEKRAERAKLLDELSRTQQTIQQCQELVQASENEKSKEIMVLQQKLQNNEKETLELRNGISQRNAELETLNSKISSKIEEIGAKEKQIDTLMQQNNSIQQALEETEKLFKAREQELQDAINANNSIAGELQQKIEELTRIHDTEKIEFKKQIENSETKIAEIQQEEESLKAKLSDSIKVQEDLRSEVKDKVDQIDEFTKGLEEKQSEIAKLLDELNKAKQKIQELQELMKANEDEKGTEITKLKAMIEDNDKEILELRNEISQQKAQMESLHMKISEGNEEIKRKETQIHSLQQEKESLVKQISEQEESIQLLKAQEQKLQDIINTTNTKVGELQHEIEELKHIHDKEKIEFKKQIENSEAKIAEIQQEEESLKVKLSESVKVQEGLKSEIKEKVNQVDDFTEKLEERQSEIANLLDELNQAKQKIQELQELIQTNESGKAMEISNLKTVLQDNDKEILKLQNEISQKNTALESLNQNLREKVEDLNTKESEFSLLNQQISDKNDQVSKLDEQLNNLRNDLLRLENEKSSLKSQLSESESKCNNLTKENSALVDQVKSLRDKIGENEKKIEELNAENQNLHKTVDKVIQDNNKLKEQHEAKGIEINGLKTKLEEKRKELDEKIIENSRFSEEIITIKAEAEILEGSLKEQFNVLENITNERDSLEEQLKSLTQKFEESQKSNETLASEKGALLGKNKTMTLELGYLKNQLQEAQKLAKELAAENDLIKDQNKATSEEIVGLSNDLEEKTKMIEELKAQNAQIISQNKIKTDEIETLRNDTAEKKTLIEKLHEQINALKEQNASIASESNIKTTEVESLKKENDQLKEQLRISEVNATTKENLSQKLETDIFEQKQKLEEEQKANEILAQKNAVLRQELDSFKSQLQQRQKDYGESPRDNSSPLTQSEILTQGADSLQNKVEENQKKNEYPLSENTENSGKSKEAKMDQESGLGKYDSEQQTTEEKKMSEQYKCAEKSTLTDEPNSFLNETETLIKTLREQIDALREENATLSKIGNIRTNENDSSLKTNSDQPQRHFLDSESGEVKHEMKSNEIKTEVPEQKLEEEQKIADKLARENAALRQELESLKNHLQQHQKDVRELSKQNSTSVMTEKTDTFKNNLEENQKTNESLSLEHNESNQHVKETATEQVGQFDKQIVSQHTMEVGEACGENKTTEKPSLVDENSKRLSDSDVIDTLHEQTGTLKKENQKTNENESIKTDDIQLKKQPQVSENDVIIKGDDSNELKIETLVKQLEEEQKISEKLIQENTAFRQELVSLKKQLQRYQNEFGEHSEENQRTGESLSFESTGNNQQMKEGRAEQEGQIDKTEVLQQTMEENKVNGEIEDGAKFALPDKHNKTLNDAETLRETPHDKISPLQQENTNLTDERKIKTNENERTKNDNVQHQDQLVNSENGTVIKQGEFYERKTETGEQRVSDKLAQENAVLKQELESLKIHLRQYQNAFGELSKQKSTSIMNENTEIIQNKKEENQRTADSQVLENAGVNEPMKGMSKEQKDGHLSRQLEVPTTTEENTLNVETKNTDKSASTGEDRKTFEYSETLAKEGAIEKSRNIDSNTTESALSNKLLSDESEESKSYKNDLEATKKYIAELSSEIQALKDQIRLKTEENELLKKEVNTGGKMLENGKEEQSPQEEHVKSETERLRHQTGTTRIESNDTAFDNTRLKDQNKAYQEQGSLLKAHTNSPNNETRENPSNLTQSTRIHDQSSDEQVRSVNLENMMIESQRSSNQLLSDDGYLNQGPTNITDVEKNLKIQQEERKTEETAQDLEKKPLSTTDETTITPAFTSDDPSVLREELEKKAQKCNVLENKIDSLQLQEKQNQETIQQLTESNKLLSKELEHLKSNFISHEQRKNYISGQEHQSQEGPQDEKNERLLDSLTTEQETLEADGSDKKPNDGSNERDKLLQDLSRRLKEEQQLNAQLKEQIQNLKTQHQTHHQETETFRSEERTSNKDMTEQLKGEESKSPEKSLELGALSQNSRKIVHPSEDSKAEELMEQNLRKTQESDQLMQGQPQSQSKIKIEPGNTENRVLNVQPTLGSKASENSEGERIKGTVSESVNDQESNTFEKKGKEDSSSIQQDRLPTRLMELENEIIEVRKALDERTFEAENGKIENKSLQEEISRLKAELQKFQNMGSELNKSTDGDQINRKVLDNKTNESSRLNEGNPVEEKKYPEAESVRTENNQKLHEAAGDRTFENSEASKKYIHEQESDESIKTQKVLSKPSTENNQLSGKTLVQDKPTTETELLKVGDKNKNQETADNRYSESDSLKVSERNASQKDSNPLTTEKRVVTKKNIVDQQSYSESGSLKADGDGEKSYSTENLSAERNRHSEMGSLKVDGSNKTETNEENKYTESNQLSSKHLAEQKSQPVSDSLNSDDALKSQEVDNKRFIETNQLDEKHIVEHPPYTGSDSLTADGSKQVQVDGDTIVTTKETEKNTLEQNRYSETSVLKGNDSNQPHVDPSSTDIDKDYFTEKDNMTQNPNSEPKTSISGAVNKTEGQEENKSVENNQLSSERLTEQKLYTESDSVRADPNRRSQEVADRTSMESSRAKENYSIEQGTLSETGLSEIADSGRTQHTADQKLLENSQSSEQHMVGQKPGSDSGSLKVDNESKAHKDLSASRVAEKDTIEPNEQADLAKGSKDQSKVCEENTLEQKLSPESGIPKSEGGNKTQLLEDKNEAEKAHLADMDEKAYIKNEPFSDAGKMKVDKNTGRATEEVTLENKSITETGSLQTFGDSKSQGVENKGLIENSQQTQENPNSEHYQLQTESDALAFVKKKEVEKGSAFEENKIEQNPHSESRLIQVSKVDGEKKQQESAENVSGDKSRKSGEHALQQKYQSDSASLITKGDNKMTETASKELVENSQQSDKALIEQQRYSETGSLNSGSEKTSQESLAKSSIGKNQVMIDECLGQQNPSSESDSLRSNNKDLRQETSEIKKPTEKNLSVETDTIKQKSNTKADLLEREEDQKVQESGNIISAEKSGNMIGKNLQEQSSHSTSAQPNIDSDDKTQGIAVNRQIESNQVHGNQVMEQKSFLESSDLKTKDRTTLQEKSNSGMHLEKNRVNETADLGNNLMTESGSLQAHVGDQASQKDEKNLSTQFNQPNESDKESTKRRTGEDARISESGSFGLSGASKPQEASDNVSLNKNTGKVCEEVIIENKLLTETGSLQTFGDNKSKEVENKGLIENSQQTQENPNSEHYQLQTESDAFTFVKKKEIEKGRLFEGDKIEQTPHSESGLIQVSKVDEEKKQQESADNVSGDKSRKSGEHALQQKYQSDSASLITKGDNKMTETASKELVENSQQSDKALIEQQRYSETGSLNSGSEKTSQESLAKSSIGKNQVMIDECLGQQNPSSESDSLRSNNKDLRQETSEIKKPTEKNLSVETDTIKQKSNTKADLLEREEDQKVQESGNIISAEKSGNMIGKNLQEQSSHSTSAQPNIDSDDKTQGIAVNRQIESNQVHGNQVMEQKSFLESSDLKTKDRTTLQEKSNSGMHLEKNRVNETADLGNNLMTESGSLQAHVGDQASQKDEKNLSTQFNQPNESDKESTKRRTGEDARISESGSFGLSGASKPQEASDNVSLNKNTGKVCEEVIIENKLLTETGSLQTFGDNKSKEVENKGLIENSQQTQENPNSEHYQLQTESDAFTFVKKKEIEKGRLFEGDKIEQTPHSESGLIQVSKVDEEKNQQESSENILGDRSRMSEEHTVQQKSQAGPTSMIMEGEKIEHKNTGGDLLGNRQLAENPVIEQQRSGANSGSIKSACENNSQQGSDKASIEKNQTSDADLVGKKPYSEADSLTRSPNGESNVNKSQKALDQASINHNQLTENSSIRQTPYSESDSLYAVGSTMPTQQLEKPTASSAKGTDGDKSLLANGKDSGVSQRSQTSPRISLEQLKEQLKKTITENQTLLKQNSDLAEKTKTQQSDIETLRQELEQYRPGTKRQMSTTEIREESQGVPLKELLKAKENAKYWEEKAKELLNSLEEQETKSLKNTKALQEQLAKAEELVRLNKTTASEKSYENGKLQDEIVVLKQQIIAEKQKLEFDERKMHEYEQELKQKRQSIEQKKEENAELYAKVNELRYQIEQKENEYKALRQRLTEYEANLLQDQKTSTNLSQNLEEFEKVREIQQKELDAIRRENSKLSLTLAYVKEEIDQAKKQFKILSGELEDKSKEDNEKSQAGGVLEQDVKIALKELLGHLRQEKLNLNSSRSQLAGMLSPRKDKSPLSNDSGSIHLFGDSANKQMALLPHERAYHFSTRTQDNSPRLHMRHQTTETISRSEAPSPFMRSAYKEMTLNPRADSFTDHASLQSSHSKGTTPVYSSNTYKEGFVLEKITDPEKYKDYSQMLTSTRSLLQYASQAIGRMLQARKRPAISIEKTKEKLLSYRKGIQQKTHDSHLNAELRNRSEKSLAVNAIYEARAESKMENLQSAYSTLLRLQRRLASDPALHSDDGKYHFTQGRSDESPREEGLSSPSTTNPNLSRVIRELSKSSNKDAASRQILKVHTKSQAHIERVKPKLLNRMAWLALFVLSRGKLISDSMKSHKLLNEILKASDSYGKQPLSNQNIEARVQNVINKIKEFHINHSKQQDLATHRPTNRLQFRKDAISKSVGGVGFEKSQSYGSVPDNILSPMSGRSQDSGIAIGSLKELQYRMASENYTRVNVETHFTYLMTFIAPKLKGDIVVRSIIDVFSNCDKIYDSQDDFLNELASSLRGSTEVLKTLIDALSAMPETGSKTSPTQQPEKLKDSLVLVRNNIKCMEQVFTALLGNYFGLFSKAHTLKKLLLAESSSVTSPLSSSHLSQQQSQQWNQNLLQFEKDEKDPRSITESSFAKTPRSPSQIRRGHSSHIPPRIDLSAGILDSSHRIPSLTAAEDRLDQLKLKYEKDGDESPQDELGRGPHVSREEGSNEDEIKSPTTYTLDSIIEDQKAISTPKNQTKKTHHYTPSLMPTRLHYGNVQADDKWINTSFERELQEANHNRSISEPLQFFNPIHLQKPNTSKVQKDFTTQITAQQQQKSREASLLLGDEISRERELSKERNVMRGSKKHISFNPNSRDMNDPTTQGFGFDEGSLKLENLEKSKSHPIYIQSSPTRNTPTKNIEEDEKEGERAPRRGMYRETLVSGSKSPGKNFRTPQHVPAKSANVSYLLGEGKFSFIPDY